MRFKTERQENDWKLLEVNNSKLFSIGIALDKFCQLEFNKDICITDVFRTKVDLAIIYHDIPENQWPNSPHLYWKAFDVRSTDWDNLQQKRMLQFLNAFSYSSGQGRPVSFIHAIQGNVLHFHVQAD